MKEWRITDPKTTTLLVDNKVTLLKGNILMWHYVIELIKRTFDGHSYDIFESEEKIHVNDYCLNLISYSDDYRSFETQNSKDKLMLLFNAYLELSPYYKNLVECWEELQEEVELLSEELGYSANVQLDDFKKKIVEDHLTWKSNEKNALDKILQQIKLTKKSIPDKRHLFVLITPENILDTNDLVKLNEHLQKQTSHFIVVSDYSFDGPVNTIYNNQIINYSIVIKNKDLISRFLPFVFDEEAFDHSLKWYINLVDKTRDNIIKLSLSSVDNLEQFIYVFLMIYFTHLPFVVDYSGIPAEYKNFIESVIESEV
ncbi:hypothetical protein [Alkalibacterium sp. 20]|uniref:hypothetical protein n=1 Tax=Alkalibacterium sp. 20 TaxID=1798803 RepID=UPI00090045DC|nr:hypothetical protein [Alkalibacterium sp. 20]OJF92812.1 hypothetical protein AX762_09505 [Alkalibacterium sp. 20]